MSRQSVFGIRNYKDNSEKRCDISCEEREIKNRRINANWGNVRKPDVACSGAWSGIPMMKSCCRATEMMDMSSDGRSRERDLWLMFDVPHNLI